MKNIILLIICVNFVFAQSKYDNNIQNDNEKKFIKLDIDKDFKKIKKLCALRITGACKKLAIAYGEGTKTIKKDVNKFAFYLEKMCNQRDYRACEIAANSYLIGYDGIKKDQNKSYRLFKLACENANLDQSCYFIAVIEILGLNDSSKNPFNSEKTLKRLCKKNYKNSCTSLKKFYKVINTKTDKRYLEEKVKFEKKKQSKNYIIDSKTNLVWQDDSDTVNIKRTLSGAKKYCNELEVGGFDDWRLPNASELFSLVDEKSKNNTRKIIKYSSENIYISSTFYNKEEGLYWSVWFKKPLLERIVGYKNQSQVRCVRGEKLPLDRERFYIRYGRKK